MKVLQGEYPAIRVAVVERGVKPMDGWHAIEIGKSIIFRMDDLDDYRTRNWDTRVLDAMILIAAVEYCDRVCRRPAMGWMRRIELRVPVHDLARWQMPVVGSALASALKFLTGDEWQITFCQRHSHAEEDVGHQSRLEFGDLQRIVTPFSDGLDSRAVTAIISAAGRSDQLIRVRVGSKDYDRPHHGRRKVPFLNIPFKVRADAVSFKESSARSRGFKFTFLSAIAAYLVGARDVVMPESGQGALGPSLVPTSHGYEDYRNHPRFFSRMEQLFAMIFDYEVNFNLPRIWKTKGQTLSAFAALQFAPSEWIGTRSCWQQNRSSSVDHKWRHCGICAACMLRRLSFHAAGLDEPKENYIWEDLRADQFPKGAAKGFNRITRAMEHYAIAGALHLDHLANLRSSPVHRKRLSRHAWQLSQELEMAHVDAEGELFSLLEQHEMEWTTFMKDLGPKSFVAQWLA
ncbi:7-cyano-7-deazaguanine synthase [Aminobacter aganoensis]|uniref:7-cyano-7-deazaguanine synthase in queuosine biosynthesis n=1 Tax=Aminobacter aganoensis TaxID=83264 RepID=A0A7X0FAY6_9HYPH|nr:7-cyano-7-deazaguanine synthase [Aminobacter aganoensis]MBB6356315.1 7-cyano-7-deazaguanine synthase in queuosine biosynthesis [Aminobacter aganoensis]